MAHYAKVNPQGIVENVIVAEPEFFDTFVDSSPGKWVQTSYNTYSGSHHTGGTPLRKNFAGIGYTYDEQLDAFIPPKPTQFNSWVLNTETALWEAPVPQPATPAPAGYVYHWNEDTVQWDLVVDIYQQ